MLLDEVGGLGQKKGKDEESTKFSQVKQISRYEYLPEMEFEGFSTDARESRIVTSWHSTEPSLAR